MMQMTSQEGLSPNALEENKSLNHKSLAEVRALFESNNSVNRSDSNVPSIIENGNVIQSTGHFATSTNRTGRTSLIHRQASSPEQPFVYCPSGRASFTSSDANAKRSRVHQLSKMFQSGERLIPAEELNSEPPPFKERYRNKEGNAPSGNEPSRLLAPASHIAAPCVGKSQSQRDTKRPGRMSLPGASLPSCGSKVDMPLIGRIHRSSGKPSLFSSPSTTSTLTVETRLGSRFSSGHTSVGIRASSVSPPAVAMITKQSPLSPFSAPLPLSENKFSLTTESVNERISSAQSRNSPVKCDLGSPPQQGVLLTSSPKEKSNEEVAQSTHDSVTNDSLVKPLREVSVENGVHVFEDGHFYYEQPIDIGQMPDDIEDKAGGDGQKVAATVSAREETILPVSPRRRSGGAKVNFKEDAVRVYSTYTVEEYDRKNEDVDPVTASAEYTLEKRLEKMDLIEVDLYKGEKGLGIVIVALGVAAVQRMGIFIYEIVPGGAAYEDGRMKVYDQIVEVNGINFVGISQAFATETLKSTQGLVSFVLGREKDLENSDIVANLRGWQDYTDSPKVLTSPSKGADKMVSSCADPTLPGFASESLTDPLRMDSDLNSSHDVSNAKLNDESKTVLPAEMAAGQFSPLLHRKDSFELLSSSSSNKDHLHSETEKNSSTEVLLRRVSELSQELTETREKVAVMLQVMEELRLSNVTAQQTMQDQTVQFAKQHMQQHEELLQWRDKVGRLETEKEELHRLVADLEDKLRVFTQTALLNLPRKDVCDIETQTIHMENGNANLCLGTESLGKKEFTSDLDNSVALSRIRATQTNRSSGRRPPTRKVQSDPVNNGDMWEKSPSISLEDEITPPMAALVPADESTDMSSIFVSHPMDSTLRKHSGEIPSNSNMRSQTHKESTGTPRGVPKGAFALPAMAQVASMVPGKIFAHLRGGNKFSVHRSNDESGISSDSASNSVLAESAEASTDIPWKDSDSNGGSSGIYRLQMEESRQSFGLQGGQKNRDSSGGVVLLASRPLAEAVHATFPHNQTENHNATSISSTEAVERGEVCRWSCEVVQTWLLQQGTPLNSLAATFLHAKVTGSDLLSLYLSEELDSGLWASVPVSLRGCLREQLTLLCETAE